MKLGRDRTVQHGFQISLYGGQGRTEIMGNICHKFLLVVLGSGNFACHIGKGCAKVADLVLTVDLKFIMHIS